jgi:hypothetical protein
MRQPALIGSMSRFPEPFEWRHRRRRPSDRVSGRASSQTRLFACFGCAALRARTVPGRAGRWSSRPSIFKQKSAPGEKLGRQFLGELGNDLRLFRFRYCYACHPATGIAPCHSRATRRDDVPSITHPENHQRTTRSIPLQEVAASFDTTCGKVESCALWRTAYVKGDKS